MSDVLSAGTVLRPEDQATREVRLVEAGDPAQSGRLIEVGGRRFELNNTDYQKKSTPDCLQLCGRWPLLNRLIDYMAAVPRARILELGTLEGGRAVFYAALFKGLSRVVSVDIRPVGPLLAELVRDPDLAGRVSFHGGLSQDSPRLAAVVAEELEGRPQIIIDDASHLYGPSRAAFELTYPLLAPGGLYLLEDWGWSHYPAFQEPGSQWHDRPALSNLVFELTALAASRPDWFQGLELPHRDLMVLAKSPAARVPRPLKLDQHLNLRGRKFSQI